MFNSVTCFLRKVTKEAILELLELGYTTDKYPLDENLQNNKEFGIATSVCGTFSIIRVELFDSKDPHTTWNCAGRIDCKDNAELFLSLCSIKDDTDKGSLFCLPTSLMKDQDGILMKDLWGISFIKCQYDTWEEQCRFCEENNIKLKTKNPARDFHKATVSDLLLKYEL